VSTPDFDGKGGLVHWDDVGEVELPAPPALHFSMQDLGTAAGATIAGVLRIHLTGEALVPAYGLLEGQLPTEELGLVLAGSGRVESSAPDDPDAGGWPLRPGSALLRRGSSPPLTYRADEDGMELLLFGAFLPHRPPFDGVLAVTMLEGVDVERLDKGVYAVQERNLGPALGSTLCGLRHDAMPAGAWSAPPHWHAQEHELFVVLEGGGELRLFDNEGAQRSSAPLRPGHVVSRPGATGVAHALVAGDSGMTYLAFGTREPGEVVYYPRSRKAWLGPLLVRVEPVDDYWEGEL
jgi:uncharacterized cupin superfamily protein